MSAPNWKIYHQESFGGGEINEGGDGFAPENLDFILNKGENGPHEISYEISRSRNIVAPGFVGPYRTTWRLTRNDQYIIGGIHTNFSVNSNEEMVKIAGKSFLHGLELRFWDFDSTTPNAYRVSLQDPITIDQPPKGYAMYEVNIDPYIVLAAIMDHIASDSNSFSYLYGFGFSGENLELFSIPLLDTETLLSKITSLSQQEPGEFDFWVDDEDLHFRVAKPRRYNLDVWNTPALAEHIFDSTVLESGFHEVSFTNTGPIQTHIVGQGQGISDTIAKTREYLPASTNYTRIDGAVDFNVSSKTQVDRLTRKALLFGLNPVHEITLTVVPEKVNNFWTRFRPGKAIWLKANLEGWNIDSAQEIVSMQCTPDLDGNELVVMKLNQIYQYNGIDVD